MNETIEQQVIETIRVLPEEKQREVLEYAKQISENGAAENTSNAESPEKPPKRKFLQEIEKIMGELPREAFEGYPTDGSLNHDHYLYGAPKREQK